MLPYKAVMDIVKLTGGKVNGKPKKQRKLRVKKGGKKD